MDSIPVLAINILLFCFNEKLVSQYKYYLYCETLNTSLIYITDFIMEINFYNPCSFVYVFTSVS